MHEVIRRMYGFRGLLFYEQCLFCTVWKYIYNIYLYVLAENLQNSNPDGPAHLDKCRIEAPPNCGRNRYGEPFQGIIRGDSVSDGVELTRLD